jgi:uncharacterized protein
MSPAPADLVNALELGGRAASIERDLALAQLPRLTDAGALEGTRVRGELRFGMFEGRATVDTRISGTVVLPCQRCLKPCEVSVLEVAPLIVVATDEDDVVPAGFDAILGDAERLPVIEVMEEQLLLGLPLVAAHPPGTGCQRDAGPQPGPDEVSDRQRPFANLRELLDKRER